MLQVMQPNGLRIVPAAVSGMASFAVLGSLFMATMLTQYRAIDIDYLLFALLRVSAISLLVTVVAALLAHRLRSVVRALLFGAVLGLVGGVAYVAAAT